MSIPSGAPVNQVRLTHIGGPTALIEIGSLRFLTDPTFEPAGYSYPAGPQQQISKTASPALDPAALGPVDAVLLSHDHHGDNLDPAGRAYLPQAAQVLTTPAGEARLGGNARGLATWETVTLTGADGLSIRVTAMPARHGPAEILALVGDVTGWLLEWEGQRHGALYLSGDTVLFEGVEDIARRYQVGLAVLNCGAARAQRLGPDPLTFTGVEAAHVAKLLGDAVAVPIHYEGWSHFSEGRAEIERAFASAGVAERLRFLPLGQPVSIEA